MASNSNKRARTTSPIREAEEPKCTTQWGRIQVLAHRTSAPKTTVAKAIAIQQAVNDENFVKQANHETKDKLVQLAMTEDIEEEATSFYMTKFEITKQYLERNPDIIERILNCIQGRILRERFYDFDHIGAPCLAIRFLGKDAADQFAFTCRDLEVRSEVTPGLCEQNFLEEKKVVVFGASHQTPEEAFKSIWVGALGQIGESQFQKRCRPLVHSLFTQRTATLCWDKNCWLDSKSSSRTLQSLRCDCNSACSATVQRPLRCAESTEVFGYTTRLCLCVFQKEPRHAPHHERYGGNKTKVCPTRPRLLTPITPGAIYRK